MTAVPDHEDVDAIGRLRADLVEARYDVEHLAELLGPAAVAALDREHGLPAVLAARRSSDPAATLARALTLGDAVGAAEMEAALPDLGLEGAERLGLLGREGDGVRALTDLRPTDMCDRTWWLASDPDSTTTGEPVSPDHVLGIGGASRTLAGLIVRRPVGSALDIGTGSGVQALTLTTHADRVVGTDISERALGLARFNAALNGVEIDWRAGSLLEPVAGERFDLVVSNPPFVISPRTEALATYTYRDGGRAGDQLVQELIAGVPEALEPGGFAQLLGNWEVRGGEEWSDRIGEWVEGTGLDAWVIQRELIDPAHYVETWLRDGGLTADRDRAQWDAAATAWLEDLAARDVEAIGFGYVILRRPPPVGDAAATPDDAAATRLLRLEEITGPVAPVLGETIAVTFERHDLLAGLDDDAVLALSPVVAPDVTEERHLLPGAAHPTVILLRQGGGLGRVIRADTVLAAVVGACDGELSLAQITGAVAALLDVDVDALREEIVPAVRTLLVDGLLDLP